MRDGEIATTARTSGERAKRRCGERERLEWIAKE